MRIRNIVLSGVAAAAVVGGVAGTALADQSHDPKPTARPSEPAPAEPTATKSAAPAPRPTTSAEPRPTSWKSPGPAPSPIHRQPDYTG